MSSVKEFTTEEFGFRLATSPEGIRVFDQGVDFGEEKDGPLRLLAIGNQSGYVACSNKNSLIVEKLSKFSQQDEVAHDCIEDLNNVTIIGFNCDESKLFILEDGLLMWLNMGDISVNEKVTSRSLKEFTLKNSEKLKDVLDFSPSPVNPNIMAIYNRNRELFLVQDGELIKKENVSCFEWSLRGDILYFGLFGLSAVHSIVLGQENETNTAVSNPEIDDTNSVIVIKINELRYKSHWLVIYKRNGDGDGDGDYECYVLINADKVSSCSQVDIAPSFGSLEHSGTYYVLPLFLWVPDKSYFFVSLSLSTEISVLKIDDKGNVNVISQLDDSERAQLPINEDTGEDELPIGLAIDICSLEIVVMEPCNGVDRTLGTLPRIWCLTHEGAMVSWWVYESPALKGNKLNLKKTLDYLRSQILVSSDTSEGEKQRVIPHEEVSPKKIEGRVKESEPKEPKGEKSSQASSFGSSNESRPSNSFGSVGLTSGNQSDVGSKDISSTKDTAFSTSGVGKPAFGASGFGASGFGSSGFGKPAFGTSAFSSSGFGKPAFGTSAFDGKGLMSGNESPDSQETKHFPRASSGSGFGRYAVDSGKNSPLGLSENVQRSVVSEKSSSSSIFGRASPSVQNEMKGASPFSGLQEKESIFGDSRSNLLSSSRLGSDESLFGGGGSKSLLNKANCRGPDSSLSDKEKQNLNIKEEHEKSHQKLPLFSGSNNKKDGGNEHRKNVDSFADITIQDDSSETEKSSLASGLDYNESDKDSAFVNVSNKSTANIDEEQILPTSDKRKDASTDHENKTDELSNLSLNSLQVQDDLNFSGGSYFQGPKSLEGTNKSSEDSPKVFSLEGANSKTQTNEFQSEPSDSSISRPQESIVSNTKERPEKKKSILEENRIHFEESSQTRILDLLKNNPPPLFPLFYKLSGTEMALLSDNKPLWKKFNEIYGTTEASLSILNMNISVLREYIDQNSAHLQDYYDSWMLDFPEYWHLSMTGLLENMTQQFSPEVTNRLDQSKQVDARLTSMIGRLETTLGELSEMDRVLNKLLHFPSETPITAAKSLPLSFEQEKMRSSLRLKLRNIQELKSKLVSAMMPLKAKLSTNTEFLKNMEYVIFLISKNLFGHINEIKELYSKLKSLQKENDKLLDYPLNNNSNSLPPSILSKIKVSQDFKCHEREFTL